MNTTINAQTYHRHGTTPDSDLIGQVHHLLSPIIGTLKMRQVLGLPLEPGDLDHMIERLYLVMHAVDRLGTGEHSFGGSQHGLIVGDRVEVTGDLELVGTIADFVFEPHRALGGDGLCHLDVVTDEGTTVRVPMENLDDIEVEVTRVEGQE